MTCRSFTPRTKRENANMLPTSRIATIAIENIGTISEASRSTHASVKREKMNVELNSPKKKLEPNAETLLGLLAALAG